MSENRDPLAAPPRRTLATRLAERNDQCHDQRELRALRLARLRAAGEPVRAAAPVPRGEALVELYLPLPAEARPEAVPAAGLGEAPVPDELAGLPGVGPGLAALLRRAGLARLADIARLEPVAVAARLGPVGRLVPAARWIAAARATAEPEPEAAPEPATLP